MIMQILGLDVLSDSELKYSYNIIVKADDSKLCSDRCKSFDMFSDERANIKREAILEILNPLSKFPVFTKFLEDCNKGEWHNIKSNLTFSKVNLLMEMGQRFMK